MTNTENQLLLAAHRPHPSAPSIQPSPVAPGIEESQKSAVFGAEYGFFFSPQLQPLSQVSYWQSRRLQGFLLVPLTKPEGSWLIWKRVNKLCEAPGCVLSHEKKFPPGDVILRLPTHGRTGRIRRALRVPLAKGQRSSSPPLTPHILGLQREKRERERSHFDALLMQTEGRGSSLGGVIGESKQPRCWAHLCLPPIELISGTKAWYGGWARPHETFWLPGSCPPAACCQ